MSLEVEQDGHYIHQHFKHLPSSGADAGASVAISADPILVQPPRKNITGSRVRRALQRSAGPAARARKMSPDHV